MVLVAGAMEIIIGKLDECILNAQITKHATSRGDGCK